MHAAARALSVFHFQGSAAAPGHVGGDGSAGLQRVRVCWGLRSSWWSVSWSVSCSPVALRVWFVLSCCQRCMRTTWHGSAPPVSRCHARGGAGGAGFSLCSSVAGGAGGLAMDAWRWRLGAGGLALEASWPVAVRRRALGAVPPVLVALGAAWLGVACGVVSECSAGFGCRGPKKRRRAD